MEGNLCRFWQHVFIIYRKYSALTSKCHNNIWQTIASVYHQMYLYLKYHTFVPLVVYAVKWHCYLVTSGKNSAAVYYITGMLPVRAACPLQTIYNENIIVQQAVVVHIVLFLSVKGRPHIGISIMRYDVLWASSKLHTSLFCILFLRAGIV